MSNSKMLLLIGAILVTFFGMLIHIVQMFETNEFVHFVCFFLWLVICGGLIIIYNYEERKG